MTAKGGQLTQLRTVRLRREVTAQSGAGHLRKRRRCEKAGSKGNCDGTSHGVPPHFGYSFKCLWDCCSAPNGARGVGGGSGQLKWQKTSASAPPCCFPFPGPLDPHVLALIYSCC